MRANRCLTKQNWLDFLHALIAGGWWPSTLRNQAAALFDAGLACGSESNRAKSLCSEASWDAAEAAMSRFSRRPPNHRIHLA